MEGRIVIVGYRPKEGKEDELDRLIRGHYKMLKKLDMVTSRLPIIMRAGNGVVVEVFEWRSKATIDNAHTNHDILEMWGKFAEVCEMIPVAELDEIKQVFSGFSPFI